MEPRKFQAGYRFFHCEDCGYKWKEATRDHQSPSGENCPKCGEWWFPHKSEQDSDLKVDNFGNLI